MARTPAQRGKIGNWLVESRLSRGWDTQERARAEVARLTGWKIPQSVYAEWESGRRVPSEANLARLHEFYGTQEEAGPTPAGEAGLVAVAQAIRDQTQAIVTAIQARDAVLEKLLSELGQYRRSQLDVLRALQGVDPREGPMPGDEPEPALRGAPATPAVRRSVD